MPDRELIEKLRRLIQDLEKNPSDQAVQVDSEADQVRDTAVAYKSRGPGQLYKPAQESREHLDWGIKITSCFEAGSVPGLFPVDDELLAGLSGWQEIPLGKVLFLDIETTGFPGAATVPFLVGLGWWDGMTFVIQQMCLKSRNAEENMLMTLCSEVNRFHGLVTYNGKSFDIPVVNSRLVITRLRPPLNFHNHLDLLTVVKAIGKRPGYGQSLRESLRRFCCVTRQSDIDSSTIPVMYFLYEKSGDFSLLESVIKHNAMDVVDMACLLRSLAGLLQGQELEFADEYAFLGAGKIHVRHKRWDKALACLNEALARPSMSPRERLTCMRLAATVLRRSGRWDEAASFWKEIVCSGQASAEDYMWLARYEEVCAKDFRAAVDLINQGLLRAKSQKELENLEKRKKRLQKILSSTAS